MTGRPDALPSAATLPARGPRARPRRPAKPTPFRWPWQDRAGRLSWLKLAVFAAVLMPAVWLSGRAAFDDLGARPLNEIIHELGLWTFRLLLVSLAVSPARRLFAWPKLILVRRMLGVAAAAYAVAHFAFYAGDLAFDVGRIAAEIAKRVYLAIGMVALTMLVALAATSTDAMVRRLGPRWQTLHRLVYPAALLGLVHFFMQAKLDIYQPTLMAGFLGWLLAWRVLQARLGPLPVWGLAALGTIAALLTALAEAVYFHLLANAPLPLVLEANLTLDTGLRPGWWVLMAGLAVAAIAAARPRGQRDGAA